MLSEFFLFVRQGSACNPASLKTSQTNEYQKTYKLDLQRPELIVIVYNFVI